LIKRIKSLPEEDVQLLNDLMISLLDHPFKSLAGSCESIYASLVKLFTPLQLNQTLIQASNMTRSTPKAKYLILTLILPFMSAKEIIRLNPDFFAVCDTA